MTTKKSQSIDVIKELDAAEAPQPATVAVLHLGHPSDAKFGTVEEMTPAEYEKFVWEHTWPRPRGDEKGDSHREGGTHA